MVKLSTIDFIRNAGTKKAFAYRVPIGDYNYLQCMYISGEVVIFTLVRWSFALRCAVRSEIIHK